MLALAYYLYVQEYFGSRTPRKNAQKITVRIPVKQEFTNTTVDYMRDKKAAVRRQIKGEINHEI